MKQQNIVTNTGIPPNPVISFSPVVFEVPNRPVPLQIKVSAPSTGNNLPVILFSHGHGQSNFLSSLRGYSPLVDFYAASGFVVLQPTHLNSKALKLDPNGHEGALFWKSRATDMHFILDHLEEIETTVPGLKSRLDKNSIVAVGHSMGGHTVSMLTGMRVTDTDGKVVDLKEARLKAGVVIGGPGNPADLAPFVAEHYPIMKSMDFSEMSLPALIVAGDKDKNPMFSEKDDWRTGAYYLSKGYKSLLKIVDGDHMLGGISGYDAGETTNENPEMVALVQRLTLAYIRTAINAQDTSWQEAQNELEKNANPQASIESKK